MGTTHVIQNSLNSGELSPRLQMREDYARYANGLRTLRNFQPLPSGGVITQYGQQWVCDTKANAMAYLIPFEYSTTQAYMLEFGALYIRFFRDGGRIYDLSGTVSTMANNGAGLIRVTTSVAHTLTTGNYVNLSGVVGTDEANGEWVVTVIAGTTFDLVGSTFTHAYDTGGAWYRPYEIVSPYALGNIPTIKYTQSADTQYLVHPLYAPYKLTRTGHTTWTLTKILFLDGPYLDENVTVTKLGASGVTNAAGTVITNAANNGAGLIRITAAAHGFSTGDAAIVTEIEGTGEANGEWIVTTIDANNVDLQGSTFVHTYVSGGDIYNGRTITASAIYGINNDTGFQATDVGRLIRRKHTGVWGYARIISVTSTTVVRVNIINTLTNAAGIKTWRLGAFSTTTGFPSCTTIYEQRLAFAATLEEPQRIWMSTTGSYEDMSPSSTAGVVASSDAVTFQLGSNKVNKIQWLTGVQKLFIGTAGEEFSMEGANYEAISALNPPLVHASTTEGSRDLSPVRNGNRVIFVQRSGREIRELFFKDTDQALATEDLTLIADHYLRAPLSVVTMAYQNKPNRMLWLIRSDGALLAFCNYVAELVRAWALMGSEASGGLYKWVAVIPSVDLLDDQAWFVVQRTIGGVTKHFIELQNQDTSVHAGLSYLGPPAVSVITGLDHLNGETVRVVGDGAVYDDQVVTRGAVTLEYGEATGPDATEINVGLAITPNPSFSTLQPSIKDQAGSVRNKLKHWASLDIEMENTLGLTINGKTQVQYRTPADPMDQVEPSFTGTKRVANLGWSREGTITVEQTLPLPATVLGYSGELEIAD